MKQMSHGQMKHWEVWMINISNLHVYVVNWLIFLSSQLDRFLKWIDDFINVIDGHDTLGWAYANPPKYFDGA